MTQRADFRYRRGASLGLSALLACLVVLGCEQKSEKTQSASGHATPSPQVINSTRPGVKYSIVRAEGSGKVFDEALQNALALAVEEVNGIRVSKSVDTESLVSDYHSQASSSGQFSVSGSESARGNVNVNAHAADGNQSSVFNGSASGNSEASAKAAGQYSSSENNAGSFDANGSIIKASSSTSGAVRRFQVASNHQDHDRWTVGIVAEIPVYVSSAASKRLKIAVLPFRLQSDSTSGGHFEQTVRSSVIDALTQSGKVAVLDRDYTQENQNELSQLQDENFSKDEASKLGNKLGADYIIVGTVTKAAATRESMYMQAIGQRVYGATHADAQLTFRLIEAATGVVQLSGTLSGSGHAESSLDAVAKGEAADLSNRVLDSLYPLRVESVSDGVFYLGRGGDGIHVGDEFRVLRQGEPIVDSDTHEILGYSEKEIGTIVVTEVESKLSKARLANGTATQIVDASHLVARPIEKVRAAAGEVSSVPTGSGTARRPKRQRATPSGNAPVKEGTDY